MAKRCTRRLFFKLLTLLLFIVVFCSILTTYWPENEQIIVEKKSMARSVDFGQSLQISVPLTATSTLIMKWSETSKTQLPWYFKDGTIRPTKASVNPKSGVRISRVWPEEQTNGDRVEEQLMFIPPYYQYDNAPMKKILLYNEINVWVVDEGQSEFISKECPVNRCTITKEKSEAPNADAILFGNAFLPPTLTKTANQVWILHILESPVNTLVVNYNYTINWTVTYRHDSDIVTPYGRWAYYDPSVRQIQRWNSTSKKTKKVAWLASNCNAVNERHKYAEELSKHITLDVYGECGDYVNLESETFFLMLEHEYKFYLAFENSNCVDYVTEKLFVNALQHNVLPIVMGGRREDYERMAPEGSYVHVDDYESPEKLAEYLDRLDADDDLYNEYFRWKGTGEFIDTKFFCRLCAMLHDDGAPVKYYANVSDWWSGPGVCNNTQQPWRQFVEWPSNYFQ